jgi:hypothetical protein
VGPQERRELTAFATGQQTTIGALTCGYNHPATIIRATPPRATPPPSKHKKTVFPKLSVPGPVMAVSPLFLRIMLQHRRCR